MVGQCGGQHRLHRPHPRPLPPPHLRPDQHQPGLHLLPGTVNCPAQQSALTLRVQQALCEDNTLEDPGLQAYFVKKYCTYEAGLSPMILYYPFILLVIATILIMVDQPFVLKLFKSVSLEEMWRVVVVESEESPHIQRQRLQHAMSVSSSGYFISYLSRTLLSLILSILPITLLSLYLSELDSGIYKCPVHDVYYYECAGIPAELYKVPCPVAL